MYVWSGTAWVQIATTSVYTAPTLGSTTIASGTTYSTITGLTLDGGLTTANPTANLGIANKQYVDSAIEGLHWKSAANLRAASNVALTGTAGTLVIDGHAALVAADSGYRILLNGQTTASENGIYTYSDNGSTYTLARSTDADTYQEIDGAAVYVLEGTLYEGTAWVQTEYTLTSFSGQVWNQFGASTTYSAGDGLTLASTTFAVSSDVLRTTGGQVISANTSSTALEIRQIGAGNAFVVEDETNPDATPLAINANGQMLIGRTTALSLASLNRAIQSEGTSGSSTGASFVRNTNDSLAATIGLSKSRGTALDSVTAVQTGDALGVISFHGTDGTTTVVNLSQIATIVDGAVSTGVIPTRLSFSTASTSSANVNRMNIDSSGNVFIGSNVTKGQNTGGLTIQGNDIELMTLMGAF
jgi:hypothetical protein